MTEKWICPHWAALLMFCLVASIISPAQEFKTLVNFDGVNGSAPGGPLVQGVDGNLYGTTGGSGGSSGTIFKLTSAGALTTLSLIVGEPVGGLVQARDGNFYGITRGGGTNNQGTVFGITPTGKLGTLYSFCEQTNCADGESPQGLLLGTDGNLYGATLSGGANGQGTIFKLSSAGIITTLYNFCAQADCADGEAPNGLVQADGGFYGTTQGGGASGFGTVFKISPNGALMTLHSFSGPDGAAPQATLLRANDGNFYGTTHNAGAGNAGTVFEITPEGTLTTLYSFCAQTACTDGELPASGLAAGTDGKFYGTTENGGADGYGTIFKITFEGVLTTLYSFGGANDINTGVVQATNGSFYGTTLEGGTGSCNGGTHCGTIFSLNVGLGQFVQTLPTSEGVGETIDILGQGFTGTTAVSFNGTAASFTVVSDTYLTATVPSGTTTGFVTVSIPGKTLKSNQKFRVTP
jgi:uncharacterized repeat protein (TIGR03803 family)